MTGSDFRDASRAEWAGAAERWADAAERPDTGASARAAEWMLAAAAPRQGERVLEVACGAGRVGLQAAQLVGESGTVVCSDFAEAMVDAVSARVEQHGIANVQTRVLDAEEMRFADDERFDVALCRMGYMLMADPSRALERTRTALRPGGRLALAVWGTAAENPWLGAIFDAVMGHLGAPPPGEGAPGPFALGDPKRLERLLADAGFREVRVERLQTEQAYGSPGEWWDEILGLGGPLATLVGALPPADAESVRGGALERAAGHARADGSVGFQATTLVALAS